jgi:XTP/dITP diphosphohydrolase
MKLYFVTNNHFKIKEVSAYWKTSEIQEQLDIELCVVNASVQEILHQDINVVVKAKALEAYKLLKTPCVVEHGGIFIDGLSELPGGIGQIIWDAIGDRMCTFIKDEDSRGASARSIIGYCDGQTIRTYEGSTRGKITKTSIGNYKFNWDPIFIPDGSTQTYGEMGPELKSDTSQSIKAWKKLLDDLKNLSANGPLMAPE